MNSYTWMIIIVLLHICKNVLIEDHLDRIHEGTVDYSFWWKCISHVSNEILHPKYFLFYGQYALSSSYSVFKIPNNIPYKL